MQARIYLIALVGLLCVQQSFALKCYSCNSYDDKAVGCDELLTGNELAAGLTQDCAPGDKCVVFSNRFDGEIWRACSSDVYLPDVVQDAVESPENETCIVDDVSNADLFCICNEDLCNDNFANDIPLFYIDECVSNPCKNNATCLNKYGEYECMCAGNFTGINCDTCLPGTTGANCETEIQPCLSNPCANNGICLSNSTYYSCNCSLGFFGANCLSRYDPCGLSSPPLKGQLKCLNAGKCVDSVTSYNYSCDCTNTGYTGVVCGDDVNECTLLTDKCRNNTLCSNTVGGYKCNCDPGWNGTFCNVDVNECLSNPCKAGSTCVNGPAADMWTCACQPGYNGTDCSLDINECASSPCQNGGSCVNGLAKWTCNCRIGYTGLACQTDINECASNPCKQGTCNDQVGSYNCTCFAGYSGVNCDVDINECASNPCTNGGLCVNGLSRWTCTCPPGFTGLNCSQNIDECASQPCYPTGGNCTDNVNGFACNCFAGWSGLLCDARVNFCTTTSQGTPQPSNLCSQNSLSLGTCQSNYTVNSYQCKCDEVYFTGSNCQTPIDRCNSPANPCQNGAVCLNGFYSASDLLTCQCAAGYTGQNCSTLKNACTTSNPCQNGGSCTGGLGTNPVSCICPNGFSGANCTVLVTRCFTNENPCKNGATCTGGLGSFPMGCLCSVGYKGQNCTEIVTACDPSVNPCQNGALCSLSNGLTGTAICTCTAGYQGQFCDTLVATNPCLKADCGFGDCVTSTTVASGFTCQCDLGYSGADCKSTYYVCTSAGSNLVDPVDCKNYVNCQLDAASGNLIATFTKCRSVTGTNGVVYQYYFVPNVGCRLQSQFISSAYYQTKTCTQ